MTWKEGKVQSWKVEKREKYKEQQQPKWKQWCLTGSRATMLFKIPAADVLSDHAKSLEIRQASRFKFLSVNLSILHFCQFNILCILSLLEFFIHLCEIVMTFFIFEIHLQCQPSRIRMSLRTIWGVTQPTCLSPPQLPQGGHQDLSKKANKFHHCKVCFFSGACTFLHSGRNIMDSRKSWGGCRAWVLCSGSRSSITPLPFSILPHCSLAFKGVLKSTKDGKMLS